MIYFKVLKASNFLAHIQNKGISTSWRVSNSTQLPALAQEVISFSLKMVSTFDSVIHTGSHMRMHGYTYYLVQAVKCKSRCDKKYVICKIHDVT